jgi:hypothetical protein
VQDQQRLVGGALRKPIFKTLGDLIDVVETCKPSGGARSDGSVTEVDDDVLAPFALTLASHRIRRSSCNGALTSAIYSSSSINFGILTTSFLHSGWKDISPTCGRARCVERSSEGRLCHDGRSSIDVVTNRQELSMPPSIELKQALGFSLYMAKAVLNGRGDEIIDLAKTNVLR